MDATTLQEKLDEKARAKFSSERSKLSEFLKQNEIAQALILNIKYDNSDTTTKVPLSLYVDQMVSFHTAEKKSLEEKILPVYVERETVEFMKKVETLSTQIEELQSSVENLQNS